MWENYIVIGLMAVVGVGFFLFEKSSAKTERLVLIAVLSALSASGRVLFAAIPSVQPSSFIIIAAGSLFGGGVGFMTGAITAFASNLILGQGPWTIWQIFCWGAMGLISGMLGNILKKNKYITVCYGFIWGMLFGWIMNLWYIIGTEGFGIKMILAGAISSFSMDLAHAVTNAVLILFFWDRIVKTFERVAIKYDL